MDSCAGGERDAGRALRRRRRLRPRHAGQSCGAYVCGTSGDCKTSCATQRRLRLGLHLQRHDLLPAGPLRGRRARHDLRRRRATARRGSASRGSAARRAAPEPASRARSPAAPAPAPASRPAQDPLAQCADTGATGCGTDGFCDGTGKCQLYAAGTACARGHLRQRRSATAARTCDGAGTCQTATPASCAPYACNAAGTACNTTCASNTDCAAHRHLQHDHQELRPRAQRNGVHEPAPPATPASARRASAAPTACAGTCSACNLAGSVGTCVAVPAGQDPLAQCSRRRRHDLRPRTASATGAAPARSTPPAPPAHAATCTGSTFTPAATCDGNGTCATPATRACAPYVCGTGACKTTCASNADCVSPNTCTAGICAAGCPGVYCDNFESDTVGAMADRLDARGGQHRRLAGDQRRDQGVRPEPRARARPSGWSTPRARPARPGAAPPRVTASVKVLATGTSGTTTAFVCLRYTGGSLGRLRLPGDRARRPARRSRCATAGAVTSGPLWTPTLALGTWYTAVLSANAARRRSAPRSTAPRSGATRRRPPSRAATSPWRPERRGRLRQHRRRTARSPVIRAVRVR